jgi:hypothetical protein
MSNPNMKNAPKFGFGSGNRENPAANREMGSIPGPGTYQGDNNSVLKGAPKYGFGSQMRP